jgi:hypothetical protein
MAGTVECDDRGSRVLSVKRPAEDGSDRSLDSERLEKSDSCVLAPDED